MKAESKEEVRVKCTACGRIGRRRHLAIVPGERGLYCLLRCPRCGLVMMDPTPQPQEGFYTMRQRDWLSSPRARLARLQNARPLVEHLLHHFPPPARVLDYHGGHGELIETVSKLGYQCTAVEPSETGRRNLAQYGPLVHQYAELSHLPPDVEPFDVIVLEGVLPHEADPFRTLVNLVARLRVGGRLLVGLTANRGRKIALPASLSWRVSMLGPRIWASRNDDLPAYYAFSSQSVEMMLRRAGLGDVRIESHPAVIVRNSLRDRLRHVLAGPVAIATRDRLDLRTHILATATLRRAPMLDVAA